MASATRHGRARTEAAAPRRRTVGRVLLATVLVLAGGLGFAYWRLEGNITRLDIRPGQSERPGPQPGGPLTLLLIGSDTRQGQDVPDAATTSGARSDTTLIAHLSADRSRVTVVSVPRDSMVPMPRNCDLSAPKAQWPVQQVNSAFSMGGPACLVATLEGATGLFVDHVAVVDFAGFKGMVDALGGVPVCTEHPIKDAKARLDIPAGRQVLNGTQALGYVRVRYTEGDGSDLGRIERQQAFLSSMVQEATRTSLLARPDRLLAFLDAATTSLTTDADLGLGRMRDIATSVKDVGVENVTFVTVPVEPYPPDANRVQWSPDAATVWQTLKDDGSLTAAPPAPSATPTPSPSAAALTVTPDRVTIEVVNATGVDGLAREVADALHVQGFAEITVASAAERLEGVVVAYAPGQEEAARTVAAAFPGSRLAADASAGSAVRVTLGAGAPAVVEVPNRLGSQPLPTPTILAPSPRPTPTITTRTADQDICS